jgi:hypothetical protein
VNALARLSRTTLSFRPTTLEKDGLHQDAVQRIPEIVGDDSKDLVSGFGSKLSGIVQARVTHGDSCSPTQLLGQANLILLVWAAGTRSDEEERPEQS